MEDFLYKIQTEDFTNYSKKEKGLIMRLATKSEDFGE